jgi:hypothetical protein
MPVCASTVPDKIASGDAFYEPFICNQQIIDYFWATYGFDGNLEHWNEGFGFERPCNTDLPLARTFTGLYALSYSAADWQNDGYDKPILNWARRYVRENIDDLRAACGDGTAIAHSYTGGVFVDEYVELYRGFWYQETVVERASTLVHEARHQGGKPHNAKFPHDSYFGAGKNGADSHWEYDGAWTYQANYLWWFYAEGTNTTSAMKDRAKCIGNIILANAFAARPAFRI